MLDLAIALKDQGPYKANHVTAKESEQHDLDKLFPRCWGSFPPDPYKTKSNKMKPNKEKLRWLTN
jgi:hypothetical protein